MKTTKYFLIQIFFQHTQKCADDGVVRLQRADMDVRENVTSSPQKKDAILAAKNHIGLPFDRKNKILQLK